MFKSSKSKNKIKAVFQLQFHATQIPQIKAKNLSILVVPADIGKPTVRLEKAPIAGGTCTWKNPVYETIKLIREIKTGGFSEKCYHFIVSAGSSKTGILGQISIDFADYAEAAKPSTVSLPLVHTTNEGHGTVLHVTIHLMKDSATQRDSEAAESPEAKSQDRSLNKQFKKDDENGNSNLNFAEDAATLRESSTPKKRTVNPFPRNSDAAHQRSETDWSIGSASDGSMIESPETLEEDISMTKIPEVSRRSPDTVENKISKLERQLELSELELQSLRKQIGKETKRGQDLSRQIVILKEEKEVLKIECQKLKSSKRYDDDDDVEASNQLQAGAKNLKDKLEEIRQRLDQEKGQNKNLKLRLQKTEDSNSELVLRVRDLNKALKKKNEEVADLQTTIKARNNEKEAFQEVSDKEGKVMEVDNIQKIAEFCAEIEEYKKEIEDLETHMKRLTVDYENSKRDNHNLSVKLERSEIEKIDIQNKYSAYCVEIEAYKKDIEELETQIDQLTLTYENSKRDNHNLSLKLEQSEIEKRDIQDKCSEYLATIEDFQVQMEGLEKQIEKKALELLDSSETIDELENQLKEMDKQLEEQARGYENDMKAIMLSKNEQERRAIQAEEALRKTRSNNALAIDRVQEEFRRVSLEMSSKFAESEKMATRAISEANDLRTQKQVLEEMLQKANGEIELIKGKYEEKLQEISDQKDLKSKETCSVQQSEIEKLKSHYNELKQGLFEVEQEKENLRKEGCKLKGDIRRKDEKITNLEEKLKSNSVVNKKILVEEEESKASMRKANGTGRATSKRKEETCSHKGVNQSTVSKSDNRQLTQLINEMELLKDKNQHMEGELKDMEERYSEISLKFAEVEGERQQLVMTVRNLKNTKK